MSGYCFWMFRRVQVAWGLLLGSTHCEWVFLYQVWELLTKLTKLTHAILCQFRNTRKKKYYIKNTRTLLIIFIYKYISSSCELLTLFRACQLCQLCQLCHFLSSSLTYVRDNFSVRHSSSKLGSALTIEIIISLRSW